MVEVNRSSFHRRDQTDWVLLSMDNDIKIFEAKHLSKETLKTGSILQYSICLFLFKQRCQDPGPPVLKESCRHPERIIGLLPKPVL